MHTVTGVRLPRISSDRPGIRGKSVKEARLVDLFRPWITRDRCGIGLRIGTMPRLEEHSNMPARVKAASEPGLAYPEGCLGEGRTIKVLLAAPQWGQGRES